MGDNNEARKDAQVEGLRAGWLHLFELSYVAEKALLGWRAPHNMTACSDDF